jgi:hypothetical protein
MVKAQLTGRVRHRVHVVPHLFGGDQILLVLQVEVHEKGYVWDMPCGPSIEARDVDRMVWRDACLEDLTSVRAAVPELDGARPATPSSCACGDCVDCAGL